MNRTRAVAIALLVASILLASVVPPASAAAWSPSFTWRFVNPTLNPGLTAFTDTTTPPPGTYIEFISWDLGDGAQANGPFVQHTFAPGTYKVAEAVLLANGAGSGSTSQLIPIPKPGGGISPTFIPSFVAGFPNPVLDPTRVAFLANVTPVAPPGGFATITFNWSFGDGTWMDTSRPRVEHVYPASSFGSYVVTLRACVSAGIGALVNCQQTSGTVQVFSPLALIVPILILGPLFLVAGAILRERRSRPRRRWP